MMNSVENLSEKRQVIARIASIAIAVIVFFAVFSWISSDISAASSRALDPSRTESYEILGSDWSSETQAVFEEAEENLDAGLLSAKEAASLLE